MKPFPDHLQTDIEPGFRKAVDSVKTGETDVLLMSIEAFADDPDMFYAHMWFAHNQGVPVQLVPQQKKE